MPALFDHIISLGYDCLPRHFVDMFDLQPKFPVRMPFDGSVTPLDSFFEIIENGFADYVAEDQIFIEKRENLPDAVRHKKYNIEWTHEKFIDHRFIETNHKRIAQFEEIVRRDRVLFFMHFMIDGEAERVYSVLRNRYPDSRFKLFIMGNHLGKGTVEAEHYYRCEVPFPPEPYVWYMDELKVVEGQEFYRKILNHFLPIYESSAERTEALIAKYGGKIEFDAHLG